MIKLSESLEVHSVLAWPKQKGATAAFPFSSIILFFKNFSRNCPYSDHFSVLEVSHMTRIGRVLVKNWMQ